MIEVQKTKHDNGYNFKIKTEDGIFGINFAGNLDLYWYCDADAFKEDNKSFTITKENYFIYSLFEELFARVKNCDFDIGLSLENFSTLSEKQRLYETNNPESLFHNNKIDWHSDDHQYDLASRFTVEELDEQYRITFYKNKLDNDDYAIIPTFSVRIRNSGTRYIYFNVPFMLMYNKLIEYEPEYHQTHIEEYLYQKKKSLSKKK